LSSLGPAKRSAIESDESTIDLPEPPTTLVSPLGRLAALQQSQETLLYTAAAPLSDGEHRWHAVVTSRKLLLKRDSGLLFSRESSKEIKLTDIEELDLKQEGSVLKAYRLDVNGVSLKGRKVDLENIQKAIESAKEGPGEF